MTLREEIIAILLALPDLAIENLIGFVIATEVKSTKELNPWKRTHETLSRVLKEWAFTVSLDGDSVQVHTAGTTQFVRDTLEKAGIPDVRVTYVGMGR